MMRSALKLFALGLLGSLVACVATPGDSSHEDAPAVRAVEKVRTAEAAFARRVDEVGIVPAFREYVGPNAIMFMPDPVVINPMLADANWPGNVDWRPAFAVAAQDGSVVVTTGPSLWTTERGAYPGYYFSIWQREADGNYKFALDGSADLSTDLYTGASDTFVSITGRAPPQREDWARLEARFGQVAEIDAAAAFKAHLDSDARILRANLSPGLGEGKMTAALLAREPARLAHQPQGGGVSQSGDIIWSYGVVRWAEADAQKRGTFVRVWRFDGTRWTISFDQRAPIE